MGFKVKDLEQKDLEYLSSIGFKTHTGSPYMEFNNFSIVLNPYFTDGPGEVVVDYFNERVEDNTIEETVPLFELYDITQKLIEQEIIYVESEEKQVEDKKIEDVAVEAPDYKDPKFYASEISKLIMLARNNSVTIRTQGYNDIETLTEKSILCFSYNGNDAVVVVAERTTKERIVEYRGN